MGSFPPLGGYLGLSKELSTLPVSESPETDEHRVTLSGVSIKLLILKITQYK